MMSRTEYHVKLQHPIIIIIINNYNPQYTSKVVLFQAERACLKPLLFSDLTGTVIQLSRTHAYMTHYVEVCICVDMTT